MYEIQFANGTGHDDLADYNRHVPFPATPGLPAAHRSKVLANLKLGSTKHQWDG